MLVLGARVSAAQAAGEVCPDQGAREGEVHGLALPDCRAYEQVSPVDKNNVDAKGFPGSVQSSPSGERVRYYSITPFPSPPVPGSCDVGSVNATYISSRLAGREWATEGVLPCEAHAAGKIGVSEDLSEMVVWAEGAALTPGAPATGRSYYLRYTEPPLGGERYRLLATVNSANPDEEDFKVLLAGFSGDDTRLVFETEEPLLPAARVGAPNTYEVDLDKPVGEQLSLVGVLPSGEGGEAPAGGSVAGAGVVRWASFPSHFNGKLYTQSAISQDGSRVFFTALPSERVYVRENAGAPSSPVGTKGECTVPTDACTVAVSAGAAHFRSATPDGAYALYTEGENLYRFNVETAAREALATPVTATATANLTRDSSEVTNLGNVVGVFHVGEQLSGQGLNPNGTRITAVSAHTLTLSLPAEETLTGVTLTGGPGGVLGVLGASNDGHTVYFAASGVLATNANSHGETATNEPEVVDLYESYQPPTGPPATTFIARLNDGDQEDWHDNLRTIFPVEKSSRVTASGETLLFTSGSEIDRYRAGPEGAPGRLTCVSCNPKRETPPVGGALLTGTGGGIAGTTEVALTRNLSENGQRVFFNTPDALLATDTNTGASPGCEGEDTGCDVYEWEADGEGSCRSETQDEGCLYLISSGTSSEQSYFGDASANGNNIFFFTRQALVPTDTDNNVDVYDARVCLKGDPTCEEQTPVNPAECGEECAAPDKPAPTLPTPASTTLTGTGNLTTPPLLPTPSTPKTTLTNRQKLAAALKACKTKHNEHQRTTCEKHAHKHHPTKPITKKAAKR
jgi:hypothetical protein